MAKEVNVIYKIIFFIALGFTLCCCGVKGDPRQPPSKLVAGKQF
jgi:predicted small lipoprotein YifL